MANPKKMRSKIDTRYFFIIIFLALLVLAFFIILPFMTAILTGIILAYIFYPVYKKINKKIKRKNISALISSLLVVLVITLPMLFVLDTVSKEAVNIYRNSKQKISSGNLIGLECEKENFVCKFSNFITNAMSNPEVKTYLDSSIKKTTDYIIQSVSGLLLSIPRIALNVFIMVFILFYLFRDGSSIVERIRRIMPLKGAHQNKILSKFDDMIHAVVFGQVLVAIVQGALGGLGFFIFGISSPIVWGIMMMFASLLPYFGTAIIWLPASLLLIASGYLESSTSLVIKGILLGLYGLLIVSSIDNVLKPKIVGNRGGLHPILVLLGVLGGLMFFGFIGIVIGPIVLALVVTFAKIYEEER